MARLATIVWCLLGASLLVLPACAPKVPSAPPAPQAAPAASAPAPSAAVAPKPVAKEAWAEEWEKVTEGAKKEGRLVLSASTAEFRAPWSEAMQRYGLSLEIMPGSGSGNAERILTERRAGIYSWDVLTGGASTPIQQVKPKGAFDPMDAALILPEAKNPKSWYDQDRLPYLDNDHTVLAWALFPYPPLAVNTNLVKPGDIKSYNDLLDPKWREKLALNDPSVAGGKGVGVIVQLLGWDYWRKFVENKPIAIRDDRTRLEWLVHGKVAVVFQPHAATLAGLRAVGAPLLPLVPQEGTWLSVGSSAVGLINKAPHPNAARVFLNWLLSKEGQTVSSKAVGSQSARLDVPVDFLDPLLLREASKKYVRPDTEDYLTNKEPELFKTAQEVFAKLLK